MILWRRGARVDAFRVSVAQGDDEVDALLEPDALYDEHVGDVDDADAAALHVAAVEGAGAGGELALVEQLDDGEVVGDERVAALDEGEGALGLADAAVAADHHADALDVEGGGVLGAGRGELVVDGPRGGA